MIGVDVVTKDKVPYATYSTKLAHALTFSPDGGEIAVYSYIDGTLDIVAADQSESVQLGTLDSLGFAISRMAWSPTGEHIAAAATPIEVESYSESLALIDPSDGAANTVVESPAGVTLGRPVWAPTGTKIAFTRRDGAELASHGPE